MEEGIIRAALAQAGEEITEIYEVVRRQHPEWTTVQAWSSSRFVPL